MSNSIKKYNGWTNYETWLVNLWLDNDGGSDYYREQAQGEGKIDTYTLSQVIKEEIEEQSPEVTGMYADMINAAISKVNFFEIAEHYAED